MDGTQHHHGTEYPRLAAVRPQIASPARTHAATRWRLTLISACSKRRANDRAPELFPDRGHMAHRRGPVLIDILSHTGHDLSQVRRVRRRHDPVRQPGKTTVAQTVVVQSDQMSAVVGHEVQHAAPAQPYCRCTHCHRLQLRLPPPFDRGHNVAVDSAVERREFIVAEPLVGLVMDDDAVSDRCRKTRRSGTDDVGLVGGNQQHRGSVRLRTHGRKYRAKAASSCVRRTYWRTGNG